MRTYSKEVKETKIVKNTVYRAKVITPNGHIIPVSYSDFPADVRRALTDFDLTSPIERAAQVYAVATGLRVTIERDVRVTAGGVASKN